jgi:hypothetical protein
VHPLMIEELAAERSGALHEQARRARLGARVAGSRDRPIARRVGLWLLSAGSRMVARPGERVLVEFSGEGTDGRRTIKLDRGWGAGRTRG